ncbi:hypothetical protein AGMMS50262_05800 [Bacteroidia bacterium]|nr:hypothetical protein AGMMS50262_05800 [Bacteroidia bacterium]
MEQRLPFEASTMWDNGLASQNVFLWQSDFLYSDMYADFSSSLFNPSGDFLTNVFGSSYLETGLSTDDGHRDHLAISSVPLGNGGLFLLIISVLYFSILLTKKHFVKMKIIMHPSKSPLKGRLWLTHNIENSQTLKAPFRGLGGVLLLFFLLLCGTNVQAQPPLKSVSDNFFINPGVRDTVDILGNDELGACTKAGIDINLIDGTNTVVFPPATTLTTVKNGTVSITVDKEIDYTPFAGFVGQDTLKYTITCQGKTSTDTALILINVANRY